MGRRCGRVAAASFITFLALGSIGAASPSDVDEQAPFEVNARYKTPEEIESMGPAPLLYSFPGSGNSWIRLLLELTTQLLTGSFYNDKNLAIVLKGEETCSDQNLVIKAHNHRNYRWCNVVHGSPGQAQLPEKCSGERLQRLLFIIRDPFASLWAEYQRRQSIGHVSTLLWEDFDEDHFKGYVRRVSLLWKNAMQDAALISKLYRDDDIHFIRYERLLSKKTRLEELQMVLKFLHFDAPNSKIEYAFNMSNHFRREPPTQLQKGDKTKATKELAYKILLRGPKKQTVADLCWSRIKSQATVLGYRYLDGLPPVFDGDTESDLKKSFEKLQAINAKVSNLHYDPNDTNATRIWKDYCSTPIT